MEYLNTTWKFTPFEENKAFSFCITESEKKFFINISIINGVTFENMDHIPLQICPNHVYRTEEIPIKDLIYLKIYRIKFVKVMLKFRNNNLSPVSSLTLTCENLSNNSSKRIFTINMNTIEKYGTILS
jgi:hypothetical protein